MSIASGARPRRRTRARSPDCHRQGRAGALDEALAVELAFKGVRVNAIAPGWSSLDELMMISPASMVPRSPAASRGRLGQAGELDGVLSPLGLRAGRT